LHISAALFLCLFFLVALKLAINVAL